MINQQAEIAAGLARLELKRRRVIFAAITVAALIASGCSSSSTLLQGAVTDLENMIQDFINEAASLSSIQGLPATVLSQIQAWIAELQGLLSIISGIGSTVTPTQLSTVQEALQFLENILTALEPFSASLPSPWNSIIPAIDTLIPVVAGVFGITITATASADKSILVYHPRFQKLAAAKGMTIISAEAIVAQYAK